MTVSQRITRSLKKMRPYKRKSEHSEGSLYTGYQSPSYTQGKAAAIERFDHGTLKLHGS